ncbi:MAG: hypothetical protein ABI193_19450, partial [Minicystis sp.]
VAAESRSIGACRTGKNRNIMIRRVELGAPSTATKSPRGARHSLLLTALALGTALLSPTPALAGEEPTSCGEPGDTGMICSAGVGECLAIGPLACGDEGLYVCKATPGISRVEICDGKDNDCNGLSDDGLANDRPCSVGIGSCFAIGHFVCTAEGVDVCDAIPGAPQAEICGDAHDSDCDGNLDNGCGCITDADCGDAQSGQICSTTNTCVPGCRGDNGCPNGLMCSAQGDEKGDCVACVADSDCGDFSDGMICEASTCVTGCRLDGSSGCPIFLTCSVSPNGLGSCELVTGGPSSSGGSGIAHDGSGPVPVVDLSGSTTSFDTTDPEVVIMVVNEPTPNLTSGAPGFHCAVLSAPAQSGAGWIFGAALAALVGLRRRRAA